MGDATHILNAIEQGDTQAADQLLPLVYDELRKLAERKMAREAPGQTLQPTALVHEAWLRLVSGPDRHWKNRQHFFIAAAEAMRRILIEQARRKRRANRGGEWQRVDLEGLDVARDSNSATLLVVDEALERLEVQDPMKARLVKLRFFVGLTSEEIAAVLGVAVPTVKRHWNFARAWLLQEIEEIVRES
jgi:RNA polymerase sigma factor (TIGR02999 family)